MKNFNFATTREKAMTFLFIIKEDNVYEYEK